MTADEISLIFNFSVFFSFWPHSLAYVTDALQKLINDWPKRREASCCRGL